MSVPATCLPAFPGTEFQRAKKKAGKLVHIAYGFTYMQLGDVKSPTYGLTVMLLCRIVTEWVANNVAAYVQFFEYYDL
jgi:hypothetical protein